MLPTEIESNTSFKNRNKNISQYDYYKIRGANETILELTKPEGKKFGTLMEKIIIEHLKLGNRTSTQNDGTHGDKKIEIKSSRYWSNGTYKFQHIEPNHDFDILITALLKVDEIELRIIKKEDILPHLKKQGQQGYFLYGDKTEQFCKIIKDQNDLINFIGVQVKLNVVDGKIKCIVI
jgi:hypothetical protein